MDLHRYFKLKEVLILLRKNIVIQNTDVTKHMIDKLNKNNSTLTLYDCSDNSKMVIDKELKMIIKTYYEDMLTKKTIERNSNG